MISIKIRSQYFIITQSQKVNLRTESMLNRTYFCYNIVFIGYIPMFPLFKKPKRAAITLALKVELPKKVELEDLLKSIEQRDEQINFDFMELSLSQIERIALAFSSVPDNSPIKITFREVFTNPRFEGSEKLFLLWDAIKFKVQEVRWEGNKFYTGFLKHIKEDAEKNPEITARNQFHNCDHTPSPRHKESSLSPKM